MAWAVTIPLPQSGQFRNVGILGRQHCGQELVFQAALYLPQRPALLVQHLHPDRIRIPLALRHVGCQFHSGRGKMNSSLRLRIVYLRAVTVRITIGRGMVLVGERGEERRYVADRGLARSFACCLYPTSKPILSVVARKT